MSSDTFLNLVGCSIFGALGGYLLDMCYCVLSFAPTSIYGYVLPDVLCTLYR